MHMYTPAELRRAEVGAQRRLLLEGEELPKYVENKPDMTGRSAPLIGRGWPELRAAWGVMWR